MPSRTAALAYTCEIQLPLLNVRARLGLFCPGSGPGSVPSLLVDIGEKKLKRVLLPFLHASTLPTLTELTEDPCVSTSLSTM